MLFRQRFKNEFANIEDGRPIRAGTLENSVLAESDDEHRGSGR